jgi:hypothetical protein
MITLLEVKFSLIQQRFNKIYFLNLYPQEKEYGKNSQEKNKLQGHD